MTRLVIEKYTDGQFRRKMNVPLPLIRIVARILPDAALSELKAKGIDLSAICAAGYAGQPYETVLDISEKRRNKKVVISLQP